MGLVIHSMPQLEGAITGPTADSAAGQRRILCAERGVVQPSIATIYVTRSVPHGSDSHDRLSISTWRP